MTPFRLDLATSTVEVGDLSAGTTVSYPLKKITGNDYLTVVKVCRLRNVAFASFAKTFDYTTNTTAKSVHIQNLGATFVGFIASIPFISLKMTLPRICTRWT